MNGLHAANLHILSELTYLQSPEISLAAILIRYISSEILFLSPMTNNPINFRDEQFNPKNSGDCHLLIQLDSDSYSYAIIDKEQNRLSVLILNYFQENTDTFSTFSRLEILKAENEDINLEFAKVKISLETRAFTFVPEELYSPADLPNYGKFIGVEPQTALLTADIRGFGIKNITAVETDLEHYIKGAFPDPLIVSQANPFIAGIHRLKQKGIAGELFLNFNRTSFEAAVIKKGTLEFYNIFDISGADDFNYFVLNLVSQLNIDRNLPVSISGEIDRFNEHYERLKKYFEMLSFAEPEVLSKGPELLKKAGSQRFFSLLSLDLCE
jgi:hypothetical protein